MPGYKTYKTFNDFYTDCPADKRGTVSALRDLVNKTSPDLAEDSKWGSGVWMKDVKLPVIFVRPFTDYVQLGFFAGSMLDDPKKLLEGDGKFVRHVKISSTKDIDEKSLKLLIKQAAKTDYKEK